MPPRRPFAVAALAAVLTLAACGDDDPDAVAASGAGGDASEAGGASQAELLDFRTRTVAGEEFDASALAGGDVVVWFWSPWCGSCNQTADGIGRVAEELGDEVAFLGIAGGGEQEEYEAFLEDHDLSSFPQLVDDSGEIWLRFGADTIRSSFFFLDDTGESARTGYGELDEGQLRQRIEALIES